MVNTPTTHRFTPTRWHNVLGSAPAELEIELGDTIITETIDASGCDRLGVKRSSPPNPVNGPIHVRGAEPGDALRVDILDIRPNRDTGWTRTPVMPHLVDAVRADEFLPREMVTWTVDPVAMTARLATPVAGLERLHLPLVPMIGCFGVAPDLGQAISTGTSAAHGGNMDYRGFTAGCSVSFPVGVAGALFFLGDCHAVQGDGEIVGNGIEISCEVTVRLTVEKHRKLLWPRGETAEDIFCVGNARPLDQALQHATTDMLLRLDEEYGLDRKAASHLMGQVVRYDIGNVVDPAYTLVCRVSKKWLPQRIET